MRKIVSTSRPSAARRERSSNNLHPIRETLGMPAIVNISVAQLCSLLTCAFIGMRVVLVCVRFACSGVEARRRRGVMNLFAK